MTGKIALITGATAGFGEACAMRFAKEGYHLIITGRRSERLNALKAQLEAEYKIEVQPLVFDVRDKAAVVTVLGSLDNRWKAVDVLVNNAGIAHIGNAETTAGPLHHR